MVWGWSVADKHKTTPLSELKDLYLLGGYFFGGLDSSTFFFEQTVASKHQTGLSIYLNPPKTWPKDWGQIISLSFC